MAPAARVSGAAPSGFGPSDTVPDASVTTALRVGWRAASADAGLRSAPIGAGRAGAFEPTAGARVGSFEAFAWRAPQASAAGLNEAMGPSFAEVPAAAAPANSSGAGEGAPAAADPDASLADASARFPGSAEERRFGSDGPGAWGGPQARAKPGERPGGGRVRTGASRGVFRRLGGVEGASPERLLEPSRTPSGPGFAAFAHGRPSGFRIMSDKAILSDIRHPTTSGADYSPNSVTKRRQRFTMPR